MDKSKLKQIAIDFINELFADSEAPVEEKNEIEVEAPVEDDEIKTADNEILEKEIVEDKPEEDKPEEETPEEAPEEKSKIEQLLAKLDRSF